MDWINTEQAVNLTGVSEATLRRWAAQGRFPKPTRLAGLRLLRWSRTAVERWLDDQLAGAGQPQPQMAAASA